MTSISGGEKYDTNDTIGFIKELRNFGAAEIMVLISNPCIP
jgi:hypothetical protein